FSIVIAGLAVSAGLQARLGPLATAYVLALAVLGPPLTRAADPLAAILRRPARPSGDHAASPPATLAPTADATRRQRGDDPDRPDRPEATGGVEVGRKQAQQP
ncbi:MAG TPA: hypothetical protein VFA46_05585, partial [Actinomycetes bacterium]|nr:hypothetical protein [Actinomycetes bacterium]